MSESATTTTESVAAVASAAPEAAPAPTVTTPDGGTTTILTEAPPAEPEAGDKPAEEAKEGEEKSDGEKAPEKVEYSDLKLPDGIKADDPLVEAFAATASEKGIPQEMAETLIAAMAPKVNEMLRAPQEAWKTITNDWQAQIKADPEVGGTNYAAMQTTVAKLLRDPAYCDPGIVEALDMTGFGNHPAAVRTFYRIAKALTEGTPVAPGKPAPSAPAPWDVMFPNSKE